MLNFAAQSDAMPTLKQQVLATMKSRDTEGPFELYVTRTPGYLWALLFPLGIVLGIRIGLFTPSEAGAFAVAYCLFVGVFIYKGLRWEHLPRIFVETINGTATVRRPLVLLHLLRHSRAPAARVGAVELGAGGGGRNILPRTPVLAGRLLP